MSTVEANTMPPALCPIILAGDTSLVHWPLSRVRMPLAFQKQNGESQFELALDGLNLLHHSLPPIVTVPSSALPTAQIQLGEHKRSAVILVEPVHRGSLSGAIASALLAAKVDRNATLLFVDCNQSALDWMALDRFCRSTLSSPLQENAIIMSGQPGDATDGKTKIARRSRTEDPNLMTCRLADGAQDERSYRPGPVLMARARTFLRRCETLWPSHFASVARAIALESHVQDCRWPDLNQWANAPSLALFDAFVAHDHELLLRPADLLAKQRQAEADNGYAYQLACTNCDIRASDHVVAAYGVENIRVISTNDATLIVPHDGNPDITSLIEQLKRESCPEIYDFTAHHFQWGEQKELTKGDGSSVMQLTVKAGETIAEHSHQTRDEIWHVMAGQGLATIDGVPTDLVPGTSLNLPVTSIHGLTNTGSQALVITEIRRGATLSDRDMTWAETRAPVSAPSLSPEDKVLEPHSAGTSASSPP